MSKRYCGLDGSPRDIDEFSEGYSLSDLPKQYSVRSVNAFSAGKAVSMAEVATLDRSMEVRWVCGGKIARYQSACFE